MNLNLAPHHVAISVTEINQSIDFYEKLGFKKVHYFESEDSKVKIAHLKLNELFLEIFEFSDNEGSLKYSQDKAGADSIGVKHLALKTDDIYKTLSLMIEAGLAGESTEVVMGRTNVLYFFIRDPDNIWVEIVQDDRLY